MPARKAFEWRGVWSREPGVSFLGGAAPGSPESPVLAFWGGALQRCDQRAVLKLVILSEAGSPPRGLLAQSKDLASPSRNDRRRQEFSTRSARVQDRGRDSWLAQSRSPREPGFRFFGWRSAGVPGKPGFGFPVWRPSALRSDFLCVFRSSLGYLCGESVRRRPPNFTRDPATRQMVYTASVSRGGPFLNPNSSRRLICN